MRAVLAGWDELLAANLDRGRQQGDLKHGIDTGQLVFEINALLHEANGHYLLFRDTAALEHARDAIQDRLVRARPGP